MRHNELSEGIDVLDSNGNVVGSSRIAAKHVRMLVIQLGHPTSVCQWLECFLFYFQIHASKAIHIFLRQIFILTNHVTRIFKNNSFVCLCHKLTFIFMHFLSGTDRDGTDTCSSTAANLCPSTNHNGLLGKVWIYFSVAFKFNSKQELIVINYN